MSNIRLWTPVANALESYRRRIIAEPQAVYEHIWRLINIHEALVVTLGSILAARLLCLWHEKREREDDLNRLRILMTGISLDPAKDTEDTASRFASHCLDGSMKAWIDLLKSFGGEEIEPSCPYCQNLANYLLDRPNRPLDFLESWRRIAPVPEAYTGHLPRVSRFAAINVLRNKLAHVPLPHLMLNNLHTGLRREILSFLSPQYDPAKDNPPHSDLLQKQWFTPLCGRIITERGFITGSAEIGQIGDVRKSGAWVEPNGTEAWSASPFVRVDSELKVSLLFRLPELRSDTTAESFQGEFHRFAAEIEPVQKATVTNADIEKWIPATYDETEEAIESQPAQRDLSISATYTGKSPQELRSLAESSFIARNFREAMLAFDVLASTGDPRWYNDVAKSKHGAALWRAAERDENDSDERIRKIEKSLSLLEQAANHKDPGYKARAFYERSKAAWHLWNLKKDDKLLEEVINHAKKAAKIDYQPEYISWVERLTERSGESS